MVKENKLMERERFFFIELKSKINLENILNNSSQEKYAMEGGEENC